MTNIPIDTESTDIPTADLIVVLYGDTIYYLTAAIAAVEKGDVPARRAAIKKALDIIIHLQARVRMDVGEEPALVLNRFYFSLFMQILQASASKEKSKEKLEHVIDRIARVQDEWKRDITKIELRDNT